MEPNDVVMLVIAIVGCVLTILKYVQNLLTKTKKETQASMEKEIDIDNRLGKMEQCLEELIKQGKKSNEIYERVEKFEKQITDLGDEVKEVVKRLTRLEEKGNE